MKVTLSFLLLGVLTSVLGENTRHSITVASESRSFLVHLPKDRESEANLPVVIVFHGGGGNADSMAKMTGLNALADEEGFIAVYPEGTGRFPRRLTFNGGICCGYAMENEIDDVAFTGAILDELESRHKIDASRVYLTGLSNGGIVSYLIASELSARIAAIAPVGGTMGTETASPARPVPLLHVHGTADEFLPVAGGFGKNGRTEFYSVDHSLKNWILANQCSVVPEFTILPDSEEDGCIVHQYRWPPLDKEGAEVVYLKIVNGGHTWPGSENSPPALGRVCSDIDVNRVIWDFFSAHRIEPAALSKAKNAE